jgi:hypothetical protein
MPTHDIIKRITEILENVSYGTSVDIRIHIDGQSVPTVNYDVEEMIPISNEE